MAPPVSILILLVVVPFYYTGLWLNVPLSLLIGALMLPVDLFMREGFSVRVTSPEGVPVEGARVQFRRTLASHTRRYETMTNPDGIARFRVHPRHFHDVWISSREHITSGWVGPSPLSFRDLSEPRKWLGKHIADAPNRQLDVTLYAEEDIAGLRSIRISLLLPGEEAKLPWDVRLGAHPPHGRGEVHDFTLHVYNRESLPSREGWQVRILAERPGDGFQSALDPEHPWRIAPTRNIPIDAPVDGYTGEGRFRHPFFIRSRRENEPPEFGRMTLSLGYRGGRDSLELRVEQYLFPPGTNRL